MLDDITPLRVAPEASVRDAVEVLSATGRQIVLVLDGDDRLRGVVTDGDIRRGLLRGVALDAPVAEVANPSPVVATTDTSEAERRTLLERHGIRRLPILRDERVVGVYSLDHGRRPTASDSPVVLMAGGRGERLRPLTDTVPKPMLTIAGMPMIEIILRNLAAQGFRRVWISVRYLAEVIIDHVGDGSALGLEVEYLHEDQPLGTAGALADLRGSIDRPFIVMNSDLLTKVDLRGLLKFHDKHASAITVGVREHAVQIPFGVVRLDGSTVTSIVEKPEHRELVSAGIYALDPRVLSALEPGEYADMPGLVERVMAGDRVSAYPIHETWVDVGRPEDLERVRRDDPAQWTG